MSCLSAGSGNRNCEILPTRTRNDSLDFPMIRPILTAAAFLVSAAILTAQEAATGRFELRMLAFSPDLQKKEAFAHDPSADAAASGVPAPIKTYLNHEFSTVILKSRKVVFTTQSDRESLKNDADIIGEVTLPEGANSAILLFLPGKDKTHSRIMAINDSKRAFPAGSIHVTNLSPLPVKLMLETKQFDFKPGQVVLIEDPPIGDSGQSAMRTFVFKNDAWSPVATGLWQHPGDARSVRVLFQNPNAGEVQLRAFDDIPPRSPQAATATP